MSILRKLSRALARGGNRPRSPRRIELSGLGTERLEGRAMQSAMAHVAPAEIATLRADRVAAHDQHLLNAGADKLAREHHLLQNAGGDRLAHHDHLQHQGAGADRVAHHDHLQHQGPIAGTPGHHRIK